MSFLDDEEERKEEEEKETIREERAAMTRICLIGGKSESSKFSETIASKMQRGEKMEIAAASNGVESVSSGFTPDARPRFSDLSAVRKLPSEELIAWENCRLGGERNARK